MNIRKFVSDKTYEWMLKHLPFKLMHHKIPFGGATIWTPRWGYTEKQVKDAEEQVELKYGNLLKKMKEKEKAEK